MNKLKRWVVHKLGGKFYDEFVRELPFDIQKEIDLFNAEKINKIMNDCLDKQAFEVFKNGFSTSFVKDNK